MTVESLVQGIKLSCLPAGITAQLVRFCSGVFVLAVSALSPEPQYADNPNRADGYRLGKARVGVNRSSGNSAEGP